MADCQKSKVAQSCHMFSFSMLQILPKYRVIWVPGNAAILKEYYYIIHDYRMKYTANSISSPFPVNDNEK